MESKGPRVFWQQVSHSFSKRPVVAEGMAPSGWTCNQNQWGSIHRMWEKMGWMGVDPLIPFVWIPEWENDMIMISDMILSILYCFFVNKNYVICDLADIFKLVVALSLFVCI